MRTRPAPPAPAEALDAEEQGSPLRKLRFAESLSWRVGSRTSVAELLKRLQALAKELKDTEQEEIDRASLLVPAKELAAQEMLTHKDAGVRAWAACCLVDVLKLCAPEAPFTGQQLKGIFTLFVRAVMPALAESADPYHAQHTYVLQSLSTVKSIVLLTDVPSSNALILELFRNCFDIVSDPRDDLEKSVEYNLTGILQCMVDESPSLPTEAIDIVLAQFLRVGQRAPTVAANRKRKTSAQGEAPEASQATLDSKQLSPAYNMAKTLCNTCADKMARSISQYYSNVIMDASSSITKRKAPQRARGRADSDTDEEDEEGQGQTSVDLDSLGRAHQLLRELWRACPGVLQNVIPQVEQELSAENVELRTMATEAIGDVVSGIGVAGPPGLPHLDPTSDGISNHTKDASQSHGPNSPSSSQSFALAHPSTYQSFLSRRNDKSSSIRAVWALAIGRIITTSAGGIGLDSSDELLLAQYLSTSLVDVDEKVRVAAIHAVAMFDVPSFVAKLGATGTIEEKGSLLRNMADRFKDRKHLVRSEAMIVLGRLWGVAAGDLAAGDEKVASLLGSIPSKIFETLYINDQEINALVYAVLFDFLLPLAYPSSKKASKSDRGGTGLAANGSEQVIQDSEMPDMKRTKRILLLVNGLEEKAKVAFFAMMARPSQMTNHVDAFLKSCEAYNGGLMDKDAATIKARLSSLIDVFAKQLPHVNQSSEDLWKFAKMHDRRDYSLIRFCVSADSDFKKVHRSMRELSKRLESRSGTTPTLMQTMQSLLYRVSNIVYNRSHIPSVVDISQTDASGYGAAAHDLIKEISARSPSIFRAHVADMFKLLEDQAGGGDESIENASLDALKACARLSRTFPDEIPKERKFNHSMMKFALQGSPPSAAKYAVRIIMQASGERSTVYAKDLLDRCVKGFSYGSDHFITKLACLSQLSLSALPALGSALDGVVDIALEYVLLHVRTEESDEDVVWTDSADEECEAKLWSLKILANRLRAFEDPKAVEGIKEPIYKLLNLLLTKRGDLSKTGNTPANHKSRLRLQAALLHLKLASQRGFDKFLTPESFNKLATVVQDETPQVRQAFVTKVKKYLAQEKLSSRFYAALFLLAYEPSEKLKRDTHTWLLARFSATKARKPAVDVLLVRFLSLLAHHPDFSDTAEELAGMVPYIMFFLRAMANESNLSSLYGAAQRLKTVQDGIDPAMSSNLYVLSDLTQAVIRQYEDVQNWSMQASAGKTPMPAGLFAALPSHDKSQEIATQQYLPEGLPDQIEALVRQEMRTSKKRKSESDLVNDGKRRHTAKVNETAGDKKSKVASVRKAKKTPKTPKRRAGSEDEVPSSDRRRSVRATGRKSYTETADSDDEADMEMLDDEKENTVKRNGRMNKRDESEAESEEEID